MQSEIQRYGQSIIPCDRLLVLLRRDMPLRSQYAHIFEIAADHGWSIEFRPDGTVRFANIASTNAAAEKDSVAGDTTAPDSCAV